MTCLILLEFPLQVSISIRSQSSIKIIYNYHILNKMVFPPDFREKQHYLENDLFLIIKVVVVYLS